VLDLRAGRAVLARGGRRETYTPVRSVLTGAGSEGRGGAEGDPVLLARAFHEDLGCDECYVADLDAIMGGAVQTALLQRLAGLGSALLVDAGVADPVRARDVRAAGAARVVVGLETLPSFGVLAAVARALEPEHVVFSLDLRDGVPIVRTAAPHHGSAAELARAAADAGATSLLVLDVARVGSGRGVDPRLVETLRRAHPAAELLAGGGVGNTREIERLADLGLDAVLVATALHDGRLTRADIEVVRRDHPSDSR